MSPWEPALVVLAGAVGSALRYLLSRALDRGWHLGTLLVNLLGSAVLGALVGAQVSPLALAVLGVGLCGGLTTYSAFAVQTVDRAADPAGPRRSRAAAYALVTVGGSLAAATLGWAAARVLTGTP